VLVLLSFLRCCVIPSGAAFQRGIWLECSDGGSLRSLGGPEGPPLHGFLRCCVIPRQSRFLGGARGSRVSAQVVRARSLGPLVKARAVGMTPGRLGFKLTHYHSLGWRLAALAGRTKGSAPT